MILRDEHNSDYVHVICNLCGSDDTELFGRENSPLDKVVHYQSVRCRRCGLVYSDPQATERKLARFYSLEYPLRCVSGYDRQTAERLSENRAFLRQLSARKRPGTFLDIGCATGHYLAAAREFGWDVYGVELSEEFGRYARQQLGLSHIFIGQLHQAGFDARFFDYVHIWHTLEHVPDPSALLTEVRRILKDDGELRIGVPNIAESYQWVYRATCRLRGRTSGMPTTHEHTYDFTLSTLIRMLEKSGFVARRIRVYYKRDSHRIGRMDNWRGKTEKVLVWLLDCALRNRVGNRMDLEVIKRTP